MSGAKAWLLASHLRNTVKPVPEAVDLKVRDAEGLVKERSFQRCDCVREERPAGILKEQGIDAARRLAVAVWA